MLTVIISTKNDAETLPAALESLIPAAVDGLVREVIVTDSGSTDQTLAIADAVGAEIIEAPSGHAASLNAGVQQARFAWLLFVPPNARLLPGFEREIGRLIESDRDLAARFRLFGDHVGIGARIRTAAQRLVNAARNRTTSAECILIRKEHCLRLGGFRDDDNGSLAYLRLGAIRLQTIDAMALSSGARRRKYRGKSDLRHHVVTGKSVTQTSGN